MDEDREDDEGQIQPHFDQLDDGEPSKASNYVGEEHEIDVDDGDADRSIATSVAQNVSNINVNMNMHSNSGMIPN